MTKGGGNEVQMPMPNRILRLLISAGAFLLALSTFALAVSVIAP